MPNSKNQNTLNSTPKTHNPHSYVTPYSVANCHGLNFSSSPTSFNVSRCRKIGLFLLIACANNSYRFSWKASKSSHVSVFIFTICPEIPFSPDLLLRIRWLSLRDFFLSWTLLLTPASSPFFRLREVLIYLNLSFFSFWLSSIFCSSTCLKLTQTEATPCLDLEEE